VPEGTPLPIRDIFARSRKAQAWYERALRRITAQIDTLVRGFNYEEIDGAARLADTLERYSNIIEPWAEAVGRRMMADVAQRDWRAWTQVGREIGRNLREEITTAPTGFAMQQALKEQVGLIKSLPFEAAQRVREIATEAYIGGRRAADIVDEILETGPITRSRATMIARTEVSRTAAELTAARAKHIGSDGFIWRSAKDKDVRPRHRKLEGKFFRWDDLPIIGEQGERGLPGAIYNCRCYPEVVVPMLVAA